MEYKEVLYNHNYHWDKKKWLSRYRNNQIKIDKLSQRLENLEQRITSIKSPNLSVMPRGSVPVTMADMVADRMRYTLRYIHMLYREALDALDIPELNTQAEGQEE